LKEPGIKLRIDLAYVGTHFYGWQYQPNRRTVQGDLAKCLERLLQRPCRPQGSGRTDAGVHALGQVAHVTVNTESEAERIIRALPGMASVFLLMGIIFYIGAVMATKLFGASFPEWFGTLGRSLYTLFQIMTLESWSMGIVRPVLAVYPYSWAFFVPFILITTFAVVNLVVGLIVNSMQDAHSEEETAQTGAYRDEVLERLKAIEARLDERR